MIPLPRNARDARELVKAYKSRLDNEKDPKKKLEIGQEIFNDPVFYPMKVMTIATLGGAGLGWISKKVIAKHVAKKQLDNIERIKNELIRTHSPEQNSLYEQIAELEKDKSSFTQSFRSKIIAALITNNALIKTYNAFRADQTQSRLEPKSRYLNILVRKYEDSLNNYQLAVYKTLFESQIRVGFRIRSIETMVQIGFPLIAFAISSYATSSEARNKAAKEYIEKNVHGKTN